MEAAFADLDFKAHPNSVGGKQAKVFFPNGYGASIVQFDGSYGSEDGLWELAVLRGDESDWSLTYDTPITDDVRGYLRDSDVTAIMAEIAALHDAPLRKATTA